jgi:hypothetical protein
MSYPGYAQPGGYPQQPGGYPQQPGGYPQAGPAPQYGSAPAYAQYGGGPAQPAPGAYPYVAPAAGYPQSVYQTGVPVGAPAGAPQVVVVDYENTGKPAAASAYLENADKVSAHAEGSPV